MISHEIKHLIVAIMVVVSTMLSYGDLVDVTNQPASSSTLLGDLDMSKGTVGDLTQFIAPAYDIVSNAALGALGQVNATNVVKDIVTNTVVVGYTDWTYSGDISPNVAYSITFEPSGGNYVFTLWNSTAGSQLGTCTTNILNPISLSFPISGGTIQSTRTEIRRNSNGIAMYEDVQALSDKIDNMDTSYFRVVGITNKNQSVQYVYTPAGVTSLQILMPESGMTKDWLVYVLATEDLNLVLPPANYWCVSETATNAIPASTPTALYFSQINDDTYSIGRQELIPVTVETPVMLMNKAIREKMKTKVPAFKSFKSTSRIMTK